jgi:hypothetical protein
LPGSDEVAVSVSILQFEQGSIHNDCIELVVVVEVGNYSGLGCVIGDGKALVEAEDAGAIVQIIGESVSVCTDTAGAVEVETRMSFLWSRWKSPKARGNEGQYWGGNRPIDIVAFAVGLVSVDIERVGETKQKVGVAIAVEISLKEVLDRVRNILVSLAEGDVLGARRRKCESSRRRDQEDVGHGQRRSLPAATDSE